MLCRQLGCEISGQLDWLNEGAASNLVVSPINMKVGWDDEETPVAPALETRSKENGTGTSLPSVEAVLLVEPGSVVELELELELEDVPDEVAPGLVLPPAAVPLSESTKNSNRPVAGLIMASSIVPSVWPELFWTVAPVNLLRRIS
jgi:hypothetical protein